MLRIASGGLDDPRVVALLQIHVTTARAQTAPGSAHALDLSGLKAPGIRFWTVWDDETLLGTGALKLLAADHGEVKSMHTAESARRTGAGSMMLRHIIDCARAEGLKRLSLETGSWDFFRPAHAFYRAHGFVECGPFGDYVLDSNSVFMTLALHGQPLDKNRLYVPPSPQSQPAKPEVDPLLENFRQETIKGGKAEGKPRASGGPWIEQGLFDLDSPDGSVDWGIDDAGT